jgi:hypothetical protein
LEDSGNKLIYISPSKYNSLMPDAANFTEGEPLYYTWWGGRFWFYPVPDDAYVFKLWYYKKPTNLKIYSTGTAAGQATAITGTSSYWLDNSNVDTTMFFAYQGDARSDGTFPWATITTVTSNTALVTSDYSGALGVATIAYYCSSEIAFPAEFDQLIQLKAAHLTAIRNRENKELTTFLSEEIGVLYSALLRSQIYTPDSSPALEDFTPGGIALVGDAWKQPFVRSN